MSRGASIFTDWVTRNAPLLIRCGILSETDQPGVSEREARFVELMRQHVDEHSYGGATERTLDLAFRELMDLGLIPRPQEPEQPAEPRFRIRLHPRGAPTKFVQGDFTAEELRAKARRIASSTPDTAIVILNEEDVPVDFDTLEPTVAANPEPTVLTDTAESLRGLKAERENPKPKPEEFRVGVEGSQGLQIVTGIDGNWNFHFSTALSRARRFTRDEARQVFAMLAAKSLGRVVVLDRDSKHVSLKHVRL